MVCFWGVYSGWKIFFAAPQGRLFAAPQGRLFAAPQWVLGEEKDIFCRVIFGSQMELPARRGKFLFERRRVGFLSVAGAGSTSQGCF